MIDGGTPDTYHKFLKSEIKNLIDKAEKLDLVVCTHMDYDHIGGLVKMLLDVDSKMISEFWYNGFLQVINKYCNPNVNTTLDNDKKIIDDIIFKGTGYSFNQEISIKDAFSLGILLLENNIKINSITNGRALSTDYVRKPVEIGKNTKIIVLGPSKKRIKLLDNYWKKDMLSRNFKFSIDDRYKLTEAFEYQLQILKQSYALEELSISNINNLEKYIGSLNEIDSSVTNGSSISFILEHNKKKYLFLGDAIIDDEILGELENAVGYEYRFEIIKMPHHGSRYNVSQEFINRYKANDYYFLTNSKRFNHPDLEVIAEIICSDSLHKNIIFNYPIKKAKFLENNQWKQKYNYDVTIGTGTKLIERSYI